MGLLKVLVGGVWIPVAGQGPVGPVGPEGPEGDVGAQGPQGVKGDTGAQGPQGIKGDTGATGADSTVPGPAGPTGATGAQGVKGDTGATGAPGATGAQGPKGDTGATGAQGIQGPIGPAGPPGPDEVFVGPADPGSAYELWFDTDAVPPTLFARSGGAWVPAGSGATAPNEVFIGPADPGDAAVELWYDSDAVATAGPGWTAGSPAPVGENLLINSQARVAQMPNVTGVTTSSYHNVDGVFVYLDSIGTWSFRQETIVGPVPNESQAMMMMCTTTGSVSASDLGEILWRVENRKMRASHWGYSSAKPLTFSAWIWVNRAGVYIFEALRFANNRMISIPKTLVSGWQFVTVVIPKDTGGIAFPVDSIAGFQLAMCFAAGTNWDGGAALNSVWTTAPADNTRYVGQVDCVTIGDQIFATEWKLEVGSVPTPNQPKDYATDLAECQRYLQVFTDPKGNGVGTGAVNSPLGRFGFMLPVTMRVAPSVYQTAALLALYDGVNTGNIVTVTNNYSNPNGVEVDGSTNMPATNQGTVPRPLTSYRATNSIWIVDARL